MELTPTLHESTPSKEPSGSSDSRPVAPYQMVRMLDCTSARTHLPSHHSSKSLHSLSPTLSNVFHIPLPSFQASHSQSPGLSGRVQSACSWVGSCQGKSGTKPRGPSASHTASPAWASESHNQGPTHNILPETQHPICKLSIPKLTRSLSFFTRQRTKSPGSTTSPYPPHFKFRSQA